MIVSGCGAIGSALEWGSSGWQFKSARPDNETTAQEYTARRGLAPLKGEQSKRYREETAYCSRIRTSIYETNSFTKTPTSRVAATRL